MIIKYFFSLWLPLAARFIIRHRRKTLATGSFILIGTAVLVIIHGITIGINDTMIVNTTHLHHGHAFLEVPAGSFEPETVQRHVIAKHDVMDILLRYRFSALVSGDGPSLPVVVYAVDPDKEPKRTAVAKRIVEGRYPLGGNNEILLGTGAAEALSVKLGDIVSVVSGIERVSGSFRLSGLYETGISRYDDGIAFIPLSQLKDSFKRGADAEISLFFKERDAIMSETAMINRHLPRDQGFATWDQVMPDLVQLVDMNEVSMKIILILVFALVGFGISNTFILTIIERFREFGILKAMGVTPRELIFIVFLESFMICIIATIGGLITGWLLTSIIAYFGIDISSFTSHNRYFVVTGVIYPKVTASGLSWPALIAATVSFVSSYIPARIAAKRVTAETLRFA